MALSKFDFALPTRIRFGEGILKEAAKEVKDIGAKKVMIVADKGVIGVGLTSTVEHELKENCIPYVVFDQIVPNPRDTDCMLGYEMARKEQVDVLIAIGGGSSIDTAKAIGTLLAHGGTVQQWCGVQLLKRDITPIIAIPTTAGTGSEVTPFAVITDSTSHIKMSIFDTKAAPKVALVDPCVLLKLPAHIMASTGVDAMTHAVEAYTCNLATPYTDAYALYAIELIAKSLLQAVKAPTIEACTNMMLGSNIAGIAFGYADVAAVHCMAEALGGLYDIPHGVANAMLLPVVTEFNISANPKKHALMAKAVGVDISQMSSEKAAAEFVKVLKALCDDVGIPKMKENDKIQPKDFKILADIAEKNVSTTSNPRFINADGYYELFHKAYGLS